VIGGAYPGGVELRHLGELWIALRCQAPGFGYYLRDSADQQKGKADKGSVGDEIARIHTAAGQAMVVFGRRSPCLVNHDRAPELDMIDVSSHRISGGITGLDRGFAKPGNHTRSRRGVANPHNKWSQFVVAALPRRAVAAALTIRTVYHARGGTSHPAEPPVHETLRRRYPSQSPARERPRRFAAVRQSAVHARIESAVLPAHSLFNSNSTDEPADKHSAGFDNGLRNNGRQRSPLR
jgi:hypothetical protein